MNAPLTLPATAIFDYTTLAADASWLQQQAENIRAKVRTTTATIIEIGAALLDVKARLEHGHFGTWVSAECGFTIRSAQNYMSVAELAAGKSETVAYLPPAVAYKIAAKSTPPGVVNAVVERAAAGNIPSEAAVREMLHEARHQRRLDQQQQHKQARRQQLQQWRREARSPEGIRRAERRRLKEEAEREKADQAAAETAKRLLDQVGEDAVRAVLAAFDDWRVSRAVRKMLEGGANA